jgi:homogentisate 1,2-dioxygenase
MSGHGPESSVFEKASSVDLKPMKVGENSLSFMFETAYMLKMPRFAMTNDKLDNNYHDVRTN